MAPEQRAGKDVTVLSDIYSLGLVLYELTTGTRAFASAPTSPSSLVDGVDPAAERIILRCLQSDPALRPPSALAVAGALPGGDPLAAALAAGETPSPQMVADAVVPGSLSPLLAWSCLLGGLALAVVSILAHGSLQLLPFIPLEKSPEVLADHARETLHRLGFATLPFQSSGFDQNEPYLAHIENSDASPGRWERLRKGQPAALRFWLRQSPVDLVPANPAYPIMGYDDPPFTVPGMIGVRLDTRGRLLRLDAVPPAHEPAVAESAGNASTNWAGFFDAAGLALPDFHPVAPEWSPIAFADERQAWEGTYPEAADVPIRVEAAAFHGRPVSFRIVEPWTSRGETLEGARSVMQSVLSITAVVLPILVMIGAAFLASRNIRLGRSDRRGAFRLGTYLLSIRMLSWAFMPHAFTGAASVTVFFSHLSSAVFRGVLVWIFYVAIEPYLRGLWPRTMISWARAVEGRWRDPLVGRDLLLGAVAASAIYILTLGPSLIPRWLGSPLAANALGQDGNGLFSLGRLLPSLSPMLLFHAGVLFSAGFSIVVLLVLLRLLVRKTWVAVALCVPLIVAFNLSGEAVPVPFLIMAIVWLAIFFRLGVLCLMVALGLLGFQIPIPATLSTSVWYSGPAWIVLALFAAVAGYGFIVSLGGQRAFGKILAEE
jgi:serine/threonine-protein kinase